MPVARKAPKDWCVECGHPCHCSKEECFFWDRPGRFPNMPTFEWCYHRPCVHGQPSDTVECVLCKRTMSYRESTMHDCRVPIDVRERVSK